MEKSYVTFEELMTKLRQKKRPNRDDLTAILGRDSFKYFSYYDTDGDPQQFFLAYTKNGVSYLPVGDVYHGNGWERINMGDAEMVSKNDLLFLKDAKRSLTEDLNEITRLVERGKTSGAILEFELMEFVDEFSDYKSFTEDTLAEVVSNNTEVEEDIYSKTFLPDENYLGYFLVRLKKKTAMIPYYYILERNELEQINPGGIRFYEESDKTYFEKVLNQLKECIEVLELTIEKQRLRGIFGE